MLGFVLSFMICAAAPDLDHPGDDCEDGFVIARTCDIARRYVLAGLRPGQTVVFHSCIERT